VTQSEYDARVAAKQAQAAAPSVELRLRCVPCAKPFKSQAQLDSHLASKKHRVTLKQAEASSKAKADGGAAAANAADGTAAAEEKDEPAHVIEVAGDGDDAGSRLTLEQLKAMDMSQLTEEQLIDLKIQTGVVLTPTDCLFSHKKFETVEANIEYMAKEFSFFIPDMEYIVDIGAFLQFLGQKVGIGNTCICCNKTFASLDAVRMHMLSTSHTKLPFGAEASEELCDFYDFSKLTDEAAAAASSDERALTVSGDVAPQRRVVDVDAFFVRFDDGRVIGHRALVTFFKQNTLASNPSEAAILRAKVSSAYRDLVVSNGALWHGPGKLDKATRIAAKEAHTVKFNERLRVQVQQNGLFAPSSSARRYVRT
jgi:pre-60S factor REI1